jgi:hypothetical protein
MDCSRLRALSYGGQVAALLLAMTLIGLNTTSRSRGMICPKFSISFALMKYRGRREDRVRAAPAVSYAVDATKFAHEHTGLAETHRPSLRNGFTAYT